MTIGKLMNILSAFDPEKPIVVSDFEATKDAQITSVLVGEDGSAFIVVE